MYTSLFDGCIVTGAKEKRLTKQSKESGPVKLWDREMTKTIKTFHLDKNDNSNQDLVKSVCRVKNKLLVGCKSCCSFEIIEKTGENRILVEGHSEGMLYGLATHPSKQIYATGSYDGFLKIWNLNDRSLISKLGIKREIRCISFRADGSMIALGMNDGEILIVKCSDDYKSIEIADKKRQRSTCVTDIKFSPKDSLLAAGSTDNAIDFFEVNDKGELNRIGYTTQLPGPVLQFDWSIPVFVKEKDKCIYYLRVGTLNYKTVVYSVPKGNEVKEDDIRDKVEWHQWTSIFGAEVIGIWPSANQDNFINCAHLATHAMKLATGDDSGSVRLFKFPSLEKDVN
jgi:WD40 repeat protein